jgi:hypothetical protein
MQQLTNNTGISLAMAVWLAHDEYSDGAAEFPGKDVISATSLLKPIRQLVLASRVPATEREVDVTDLISSRLGTAIHDSIEHSWKIGYADAMRKLGYPEKVISRVVINPTEVVEEDFPIYLEQRFFREVPGTNVVVSGKFDQIINGEVNDTKTTSVYTYINRTKEDDYRIQGSIYRWINPDKITSDIMRIQHVFTDWQSSQARINPDYPQSRLVEFSVSLMSLEETEAWIKTRLRQIMQNQSLPEEEVVRCTDKELWKTDPVYKYYSNPETATNGGRATKNFPNYPAAASYKSKQGKGVVVTVPGTVKACRYCAALSICSQAKEYNLES